MGARICSVEVRSVSCQHGLVQRQRSFAKHEKENMSRQSVLTNLLHWWGATTRSMLKVPLRKSWEARTIWSCTPASPLVGRLGGFKCLLGAWRCEPKTL